MNVRWRSRRVRPVATLAAAVLAAGCSGDPPEAPGILVRSSAARVTAPDTTPAEARTLVAGDTELALAMYRELSGGAGNLVFSPHGISTVLAMTYAGARGRTATQLAGALRIGLADDRLHAAFDWLDLELASRAEGAQGVGGEPFTLGMLDSIWVQKDESFAGPFLDTLAASYGAGVHLVDFAGAPEPSRSAIDEWVSEVTDERIQELLPRGSVDATTRLLLTSAAYLSAAWSRPFDPALTRGDSFHSDDGTPRPVRMMQRDAASTPHAIVDGVVALELPYDGDQLAMLILMPPQGGLPALEAGLGSDGLADILSALVSSDVSVALPRFVVRQELSLEEPLERLGVEDAFDPASADFSGMNGRRDLRLAGVYQQTFLEVGERGTATAGSGGEVVTPPGPADLRIDRPFLFLVRDLPTGSVLMMGRVVRPSGT